MVKARRQSSQNGNDVPQAVGLPRLTHQNSSVRCLHIPSRFPYSHNISSALSGPNPFCENTTEPNAANILRRLTFPFINMALLPSSCMTRTPVTNWAHSYAVGWWGIGRRGVTVCLTSSTFFREVKLVKFSAPFDKVPHLSSVPGYSSTVFPLFLGELKVSPRFINLPPGTQLLATA
jgi:hypothetical protein